MALVNFLFGNRFASGFQLGTFQAEMTMEEMHERNAEVTDYPIEDGTSVGDSVIKRPNFVRLVGFVTESPAAPLLRRPSARVDAFKALDELFNAGEPLTVITGYTTYDSMVITRLQLPRERDKSMVFTVELKHIKIVKPQIEATSSLGIADVAAKLVDLGKQSSTTSSPATGGAASSILSGLVPF